MAVADSQPLLDLKIWEEIRYIGAMKHIAIIATCASLVWTPAFAQTEKNDMKEGMDLLSQGTQLLLRGLMGELRPALRDLEGALSDLNAYYPPEVLPNGDIIIRRKVPLQVKPKVEDEDEIEL